MKAHPNPLHANGPGTIPIRRQLAAQLEHVIEGGGIPRDQALPGTRALAGFLGIDPRMVGRVIGDLERRGYVESRKGKGVFLAQPPPVRPSVLPREDRPSAAASLPASVSGVVDVLLVECSEAEFDFLARELAAHLGVRVDRVVLGELAGVARRPGRADRWGAAVTSFGHLPAAARLLARRGVPVVALLAEAHLETLHWLAQLAWGTRVGVASAAAESAHNLAHAISNAGLPNIIFVGASPAGGAALGRLVRQVDVIVCSSAAAERVRGLAGSAVRVMIDDRAVDQRAIDMLAALLVRQSRARMAAAPPAVRGRLRPRFNGRRRSGSVTRVRGAGETMRTSGTRANEEDGS